MIYFIENAGLIKIGYAADIPKRLEAFKTTLPALKLVGSMEGTRGHERTIHDFLAAYRKGGEWFEDREEVRAYMTVAMAYGVVEWKPERTRDYKPSMWDQRADRLCDIICADRPKEVVEFRKIEKEHSIPTGTIWNNRYRRSREISVGEFFSLVTAAREVIKRRRLELDRAEAFVSDLEREDAEKTNETIDAERQFEAVRERVWGSK